METWLLNHPGKKKERKRSNQIKTMEEIEAKTFLQHDCKSVAIEKSNCFRNFLNSRKLADL